ncbi:TraB/GumN family protein [Motiliproteus coralliicola]|uniref:TraB/GumN family protein n=1 Tax=Motiliproteus coralliicola TaxID=2283196 RepID=A0A369WUL8_9GAMM|nr:TraB/GumN family protein [Motiliproteus coralliicola]RDE24759.1 TraB/GumN family protein [Motiliproteus coralliicola]
MYSASSVSRHPARLSHYLVSKRSLALLALLLLLCLPWVSAQAGQPFLWQLEHNGRSHYLFGTIHSGHPELNQLPASVEKAFNQADRFYGELTLDPPTLQTTQQLLQLPPGRSLSSSLPPKLRQRSNQELARINPNLNLALFDRLKLWAFTVALTLIEDQLNYGQQPAMDQRLYQRALQAGKKTGALETPQQQVGVFEQLSFAEQIAMLEATLDSLAQQTKENSWMQQTYAAYRSGDPDQLNSLFETQWQLDDKILQKLERGLIDNRNRLMAQRVEQELRAHPQQSLFIAIGAAHFGSENGVQALLQRSGYSVSRVID